jgi:anti-sigma B factor antagonist
MKLHQSQGILVVTGLQELNATNAASVRDGIRGSVTPEVTGLDIDLSKTRFVDSSGLGALIALHKLMLARGGQVRVLNPIPAVEQVFEITRLNRLFEVVKL